ncbi:homocysteine S-methyltransferase [Plantibacter sp. VKM Ac-2880]|uniref:homocysteine S-methyltransferase n=1 Tax=Plantibacter sp. VKM Ac-2880 TaxID=2783827 RepID=UPI00188FACAE|nr:homocysteine S-methyltransferase [Plantibacter sp. VKM Ac-2880]MBF4569991.1 homocysteine S-methyltransferase [Plantibacter sp. VKM Ac-2880]
MDLRQRSWTIDGGLGTLLEARGHDLSDALWSARLLVDEPAAIQGAHQEFFTAGAQIAITASYQVGFEAFERIGFTASDTERLLRSSVDLACRARDTRTPSDGSDRLLVAASVGPYGATLGDGSEYRGDSGLTRVELRRWHERRVTVLADAGPDLLALETIPSLDEATALAELVRGSGVPAWLSFTVEGGRLRSGEPMEEGFRVVDDIDEFQAVGVNCTHPDEVLPAIVAARSVTDKAVVVYPNSGERWDGRARVWRGESGTAQVEAWTAAGATIVGGCCRVMPQRIAEIRASVDAPGAPR